MLWLSLYFVNPSTYRHSHYHHHCHQQSFVPFQQHVQGLVLLTIASHLSLINGTQFYNTSPNVLEVGAMTSTMLINNQYLAEEQSCQISPQSDLKQQSLRLFLKKSPPREQHE